MRLFLYLLASLFPFFLTANPTVVTENDPNSFVNGVNVITGDFCMLKEDVVIQGTEPISLQRSYVSQKGKGYFEQFSHLRAFINAKARVLEVIEKNGSKLFYEWDYKGVGTDSEKIFHPLDLNKQGISNTAKGSISGKTNLKNQKIHLYKDYKKFSITTPDGTKRVYVSDKPYAVEEFMDQKNSALESYTDSYILIREDLPNGNQIHYEWPKDKKEVWKIRSSNSEGTTTYAWAKFHPKYGKHGRSHGDYGVETSDGRHFEYYFFSYKGIHQLKEVRSDENPTQIYKFFTYGKKKMIQSILLPENRSLHVSYYTPEDGIEKDNPICFRVKELLSASNVVTHKFIYDIPNKKTTVLDAKGVATDYYWDDNSRLIKIDRFVEQEKLYNSESFLWGEEGSKDFSNLLCKVLFDETRNPISATSYSYDAFGNIQKQQFFGNLTGKGTPLQLSEKGFPLEGSSEVYTKKYTYSKDGKNLLLKAIEENGLSIEYSYCNDTSLLTCEVYYDHNIAQKQKLYEYRDTLPVREVLEDLQGSTRLIKEFLYKEMDKALGLPFAILEMHGRLPDKPNSPMYAFFTLEPLLQRTEFSYGQGGRIIAKQMYDADVILKYKLEYKYERGLLISETDPHQNVSLSKYDLLGNKIWHKASGSQVELHMGYDLCNRQISYQEKGPQSTKSSSCTYNSLGQKEEVSDEYQNKTCYVYDRFGQVLKTHLPSGAIITSEYDASGNEITRIDAKGNKTTFSYNAYNKPVQILYPDHSSELFYYNTDGSLKTSLDPEGVETEFSYDVFGRVLSKKVFFESKLLNEEYWTYDSFNLLSYTDGEDHKTIYKYDTAGRKIAKKTGEEIIQYEYDSLGRLFKTSLQNLTFIQEYNLLNQLISEKKQDGEGNLLEVTSYEYDLTGNLLSKTIPVEGKNAVERLVYDPFNRIVQKIDPLGSTTSYLYNDSLHQEKVIDPLRQETTQTFNAQNQVIHLEKKSPNGVILLNIDYFYDLNGNLVKQDSNSICTTWNYDSMNRLVTLKEGVNTSEEKTTSYSYNSKGLLHQLTKPSGLTLTNLYDPLGRLSKQFSSDHSIYYTYEYDRNGSLLKSTDENTGLFFTRSYDLNGRLLRETLPSNLTLQREYDKAGRRSSLLLPDNSSISYQYDALHLKSVSRVKDFTTLYTHIYSSYDLSGHVLEEIQIGASTLATHHYDLLGRRTSTESPYFQQELIEFDLAGNLLKQRKQQEVLTYSYDPLYQLTEEKEHNYSYDTHHNRISKDTASFTVNSLNQTSELTYGQDGNPVSWKDKKLSYDALDRLISVEDAYTKILYGYDSLHRRIYKKTYLLQENFSPLTSEIYYLYDDQNEIGSMDGSNNFIDLRILGSTHTAEIGSAIALELYGEIYLPIHDLQGNVALLYSLANHSLEHYTYTAFGEELLSSSLSPWRFSSKRIDPETGFIFYGRRFYLPETGRFLTQDPLGLEAGPNLYAFVSNSPLLNLDLYGLIENNPSEIPYVFDYNLDRPAWTNLNLDKSSTTPIITYTAGSVELPKGKIFFVNGIKTTLEEAQEYSSLLSSYGDGVKISGIYNPTQGIKDPIKAARGMLYFRTPASFEIERQCENFYNTNKNNDHKMFWVGHSDGTTQIHHALMSLDQNIQQRCIVLAIAPATIVSRILCFMSDNYRIDGDVACYVRPNLHTQIRLHLADTDLLEGTPYLSRSAGNLDELVTLPRDPNTNISPHSFNNPGFKERIQKHIREYSQEHGGL